MWDEIQANARAGVFPKETDVLLYKYSGLFFVAPAQNSFMCRLRIPGGVIRSWQFRGVADLARRLGGGYVDVTTRANLQIREIGPHDAPAVLNGLAEIGIVTRGSGADNIRNVTASPTSGIDPQELIETLPLAREMHHYILNHREMYGLPRKFNIAFDGGGRIASLDDTNDIGFKAVRVRDDSADDGLPPGVYFRLTLGGITGHKDFARDTGVLLRPEECVAGRRRRSSASSSGTATGPTARRPGSSTSSTTGASRSSSTRSRRNWASRSARSPATAASPRPRRPLGARRVPPAEAAGQVLRRRRPPGRPDDLRADGRPGRRSPSGSAAARSA